MGTEQLLLLTLWLSLTSAQKPQNAPRDYLDKKELLGKWYIVRWAGNPPLPEEKKRSPLPPFSFGLDSLRRLEFRMNLQKPTGCLQYKMPLTEVTSNVFTNWWGHIIYISFLSKKTHAIASFKAKMEKPAFQMLMLMGRTLVEDPLMVRMFEALVTRRGLNRTDIINPPHVEACKLPGES